MPYVYYFPPEHVAYWRSVIGRMQKARIQRLWKWALRPGD